jgi:hypothetical protein
MRCPRCGGNVLEAEPGERSCMHCGAYWMDYWRWVTETFLEVLEILELREQGQSRRYLHRALEVAPRRQRKVAAA